MIVDTIPKHRKLVHFTMGSRIVIGVQPVCGERMKWNTMALSFHKEEVTCKKCKNTPQFIIHDFNRRFGIK